MSDFHSGCVVGVCVCVYMKVGQRHGGFTGLIQRACSMAQSHIWFERKVAKDRLMVSQRFADSSENTITLAFLIFLMCRLK